MVMALMSKRCNDIVKGNEAAPKAPIPLPDDELSSTPEAINEYNKSYERHEVRLADYKSRFGKAGWLINHVTGDRPSTRSLHPTHSLQTPILCP